MKAKQQTFNVGDEKIVIKSKQRTSMGNLIGYVVNINGEDFKQFTSLTHEDAIDRAYVRWVKKYK